MQTEKKAGMGQVISLVIVALVLAAGYMTLDRYSAGQKDMLTAETRGMNMIQALTRSKLDSGNYPEALDKLVPQFTPAVAKCPDGSNIAYKLTGAEFTLTCDGVVFKSKPYTYDSLTKAWTG